MVENPHCQDGHRGLCPDDPLTLHGDPCSQQGQFRARTPAGTPLSTCTALRTNPHFEHGGHGLCHSDPPLLPGDLGTHPGRHYHAKATCSTPRYERGSGDLQPADPLLLHGGPRSRHGRLLASEVVATPPAPRRPRRTIPFGLMVLGMFLLGFVTHQIVARRICHNNITGADGHLCGFVLGGGYPTASA